MTYQLLLITQSFLIFTISLELTVLLRQEDLFQTGEEVANYNPDIAAVEYEKVRSSRTLMILEIRSENQMAIFGLFWIICVG